MSAKKPRTDDMQLGPIYTWPEGVAAVTGLSAPTLRRMRANGDSPALYAIAERHLVTTGPDLMAWIRAKSVPVTYKCRPPTRAGKGSDGAADTL